MTWNESLSVGYELIDNQHRELFARIDSFYEALKAGRGKQEVLSVLAFLQDYTVKHFTAEEGLQRKYNYPKYIDHKKLHDGFVRDVANLKADIGKNGVTVATGALMGSTLSNWLISHISVQDKALASYIKTQG